MLEIVSHRTDDHFNNENANTEWERCIEDVHHAVRILTWGNRQATLSFSSSSHRGQVTRERRHWVSGAVCLLSVRVRCFSSIFGCNGNDSRSHRVYRARMIMPIWHRDSQTRFFATGQGLERKVLRPACRIGQDPEVRFSHYLDK